MTNEQRDNPSKAVTPLARVRAEIGRSTRAVRDLLFPPRCLSCAAAIDAGSEAFCLCCREAIALERAEPACPTCAASVAPFEVANERCRRCRGQRPRVIATIRAGAYRERVGALIRAYKYHGREALEPVLTRWLAEVVEQAPWLDRVEAVVSVPTHWRHRLRRPLYPAEILAAGVARSTHLPHLPLLRRTRAGLHQVGLSYPARLANVRGVFALRPGVRLHHARLLLIDDVKTTGATLEECAKVFRKAGAAEVYAAILVKVDFEPGAGSFPRTI